MRLLRCSVAATVPVLGVCLGAQLLASACGGTVRRSPHGLEVGVLPVEMLPASAGDPLLGAAPRNLPAVLFHGDEVAVPPPGAIVLARTDQCAVQAFRLGESTWGVQFHPEAGVESVASWVRAYEVELHGRGWDPNEVIAEVRHAEPELRTTWGSLLQRWLDVVSAGARAKRYGCPHSRAWTRPHKDPSGWARAARSSVISDISTHFDSALHRS